MNAHGVSAGHFFVGLGAGIAILAVPVLTLTPGREIPQRLIGWIDGQPAQVTQLTSEDAAGARPLRGYKGGDPTAGPEAPPTLSPAVTPTAVPQPTLPVAPAFAPQYGASSVRTGVIRSGGTPVAVRRVAGVDGGNDPVIADGSPVLVSTGAGIQAAGQEWRAIRGLGGLVGWVPSSQLTVDGEAPPPAPMQVAAAVAASPTASGAGQRGKIGNTDGAGVVLRNSPNDADRTHSGLMDGAAVTVLERAGADWVHVRADNGATGWIPAKYLGT